MLVILLGETAIMLVFALLGVKGTLGIILDPILLTLVGALVLNKLIVAPFRRTVAELEKTEEGLRQRTEELEAANAELAHSNRRVVIMTQALRRHHEEMVQREKMMTMGTMAAGIAHEIGNPLASISATIQWLTRHAPPEDTRERLHDMEGQVNRIAGIMKHMLEFARPSPGEWAQVDVNELVEQTLAMARYSRRSRHARVDSIPNRDLPPVRLMPQQVQQVLVNILLNAFDAVEMLEDERATVTVERVFQSGHVKVIVADRGVGMSDEQISQAFEPFYTTKPPGKGTGLGLAVSYKLIRRQGGRITIESAPGRGTTVTVSLPVARSTSKDADADTDVGSGFWEGKVPCWTIRDCAGETREHCPAHQDQSRPCWDHQDTFCTKMFGARACLTCEVLLRYVGNPQDDQPAFGPA